MGHGQAVLVIKKKNLGGKGKKKKNNYSMRSKKSTSIMFQKVGDQFSDRHLGGNTKRKVSGHTLNQKRGGKNQGERKKIRFNASVTSKGKKKKFMCQGARRKTGQKKQQNEVVHGRKNGSFKKIKNNVAWT